MLTASCVVIHAVYGNRPNQIFVDSDENRMQNCIIKINTKLTNIKLPLKQCRQICSFDDLKRE